MNATTISGNGILDNAGLGREHAAPRVASNMPIG